MEWHGAYTVEWVIDGRIRASEVVGSLGQAEDLSRYWESRGASSIRVTDSNGKDCSVKLPANCI